MRSKILSMKQKNGFPERTHAAIPNLTFSVRSVRRVTVSEKKYVVYCHR